jgi:polysaccharide deacetylase 2 family uncharacterized protein YibQ
VASQPKKTSRRKTGGARRRQRLQALVRRSGWAGYAVALVIGIGIALLLALPLQQHLQPRTAPRPALSGVVPPPAPPPAKPAIKAAAAPPPAAPAEQASLPPASTAPAPAPPPPTLPAWQRFAVPAPEIRGRPQIAIIIDDMGVERANADRVVALPGPLTLSFMTYAEDVAKQAGQARRHGHELMVHVPMEPLDGELDAGPQALLDRLPADELMRRLRWDLSRFDGYVGINNHMGSRFTQSREGMRLVLQEVKARGLLFIDSRTIADSVGGKVAAELGVPHADRDIFLDNEQEAAAVEQQLARTEEVARKRGYAIAIGHPHHATIAALTRWLPTLERRGFVLVPVSAIVRRAGGPAG